METGTSYGREGDVINEIFDKSPFKLNIPWDADKTKVRYNNTAK